MLHRINLPDCEVELNAVLQFQRKVLALACEPQLQIPLDESELCRILGDEHGKWFWPKLWIRKKKDGTLRKSELHKGIETLAKYVAKSRDPAGMQQKILDAFDHDIYFHEHITDHDFRFFYLETLTERTRKAIRPLMESFYTHLLAKSGFPTCIHGHQDAISRDAFLKLFWQNNLTVKVCPACDAPQSDQFGVLPDEDAEAGDDPFKAFDDADHFLPKSKYPFLSVHRHNLVPLCLSCNRTFKGEYDPIEVLDETQIAKLLKTRDPLDSPDAISLINSFHPYQDPAIEHIEVIIGRNGEGVRLIDILDEDQAQTYRVVSFKRVLRLHKRWPKRLKDEVSSLQESIKGEGRRNRRKGQVASEDEFRKDLCDMFQDYQDRIGKEPWCVLIRNYLRFALTDKDEFQELYAQSCGI